MLKFNTFLLFIIPLLFGSAPFNPPKLVSGTALKINLKVGHGVKALAWKGQQLIPVTKEKTTLVMKREALGSLPKELILFPGDPKKAPIEIIIDKDQEVLKEVPQWKDVGSQKVILWGETPQAVCRFNTLIKEPRAAISLIFFPRPKVKSINGSFFLSIKKESYPIFFHGFTNHGKIGPFEALPLGPANEAQRTRCMHHHGGPCDFLFQIPENAYGSSLQLKFPPVKKNPHPCPV